MKKLFLLLFTFLCLQVNSQDVIYLRNNDSIVANVTKIDENTIEYKFEGEEFVMVKNKKSIHKIKFKSGREEVFNESVRLPQINGEEDSWRVIVTYIESDVLGLEKLELLEASSKLGAYYIKGSNAGYWDCINDLKRQAAKLGGCVILVHNSEHESLRRDGSVFVKATAYK